MNQLIYNISSELYDVQQLSAKHLLTDIHFIYPIAELTSQCFRGCSALTSVDLPTSLKSIADSAFADCAKLSAVDVNEQLSYMGNNAFENCSMLKSIDISHTKLSTIENNCFANTAIPQIALPRDIKTIKPNAFFNCSRLSAIQFNESIENIGKAAFKQTPLQKLLLQSTKSTHIDSQAFANTDISTVHLGTNIAYIGKSTFKDCTRLQRVLIEYADNLLIDDQAFLGCCNLEEVVFINHNAVASLTLCDDVFSRCNKLTTINLPNNTVHIGIQCFKHCCSLLSVKLPDSLSCLGDEAFSGCTNLSAVNIPRNIKTLGNGIFEADKSLNSLTFPESFSAVSAITLISEI